MRQNLYVYSLYRSPDLDDQIFDSLLASMAAVQAEDVHASFLFVGDLNGHHQEWLGSMTMNRHGVAAFDFATVSGCDQLVDGPTHARGGTLDLLMTDVPDLVRVAVVATIGNSDHSSLLAEDHRGTLLCLLSVSKIIPEGHREGNKSPAVLQGSAARQCISVPMCDQSTACNRAGTYGPGRAPLRGCTGSHLIL